MGELTRAAIEKKIIGNGRQTGRVFCGWCGKKRFAHFFRMWSVKKGGKLAHPEPEWYRSYFCVACEPKIERALINAKKVRLNTHDLSRYRDGASFARNFVGRKTATFTKRKIPKYRPPSFSDFFKGLESETRPYRPVEEEPRRESEPGDITEAPEDAGECWLEMVDGEDHLYRDVEQ